ncbi:hypothetical protein ALC57_04700 [Trachymyrmex cornetzi]|uniref:Uncharacterized protein n=1 Tax=Trachymyrmex cornetzi TaxID=471704 RepID=A0A195EDN1_9HYME|nr:hypothetical protein ALC57_04700 [Trachymyrmex cornetzi]
MQKRDATKEKLARLVGNTWNVRTRSRMVFYECICVCTYLYVCMPRESSVMNLKSQDCIRLARPHTSFEIVSRFVKNKVPVTNILEASRIGRRPRERQGEKEPKEETERKKEGDLGSDASRERVPFLPARE